MTINETAGAALNSPGPEGSVMTNQTAHGIAERIEQFAEHYLGHVDVSHDSEYGDKIPARRIREALTQARDIASKVDGETPVWDRVPLLDADGNEKWGPVEAADREQLQRALVYAAGEMAALQREFNETAARAVSLIRLLGAEQPKRECRDTECGYIDPGVAHFDH